VRVTAGLASVLACRRRGESDSEWRADLRVSQVAHYLRLRQAPSCPALRKGFLLQYTTGRLHVIVSQVSISFAVQVVGKAIQGLVS
jgi:hypothetical protein